MPDCVDDYDELPDVSFDEDNAADAEYDPCPDGLGMPSDYGVEYREENNLETLAEYELIIRVGLAFDQLDAVRMAVKHRAAHIDHKKKNARGSKANTLAQEEINDAALRAQILAVRYNINFGHVQALRPAGYDATTDASHGARLRRLEIDCDLTIANMQAPRTLHDSKRVGSWIWSVFAPPPSDHGLGATKTRANSSNSANSSTGPTANPSHTTAAATDTSGMVHNYIHSGIYADCTTCLNS